MSCIACRVQVLKETCSKTVEFDVEYGICLSREPGIILYIILNSLVENIKNPVLLV